VPTVMVFGKRMPSIEKIENFGLESTIDCYCGKKIKIKYDETKPNKNNTTCKHCGYCHMDFIYTMRKHAELSTFDFLKGFFE
jgi:hypothetical protein